MSFQPRHWASYVAALGLFGATGCESSFRAVSPTAASVALKFAQELPKIPGLVPIAAPETLPVVTASPLPSTAPITTDFLLYVANGTQNTISTFKVNAVTGLSAYVGSYASGTTPYVLAVHPSGKYIYAVNVNSNDISAYRVSASGALAPIGMPVKAGIAADSAPTHIAISPNGKFVYVTLTNSPDATCLPLGKVTAFRVSDTDGSLSGATQVATGCYPHSVVLEPSGKFAYAVNYLANSISAYSVHPTTGALSPISAVNTSGAAVDTPFVLATPDNGPRIATPHPNGKFLYVNYEWTDQIGAFQINPNGSLSHIVDVAFGMPGAAGGGLQLDPSGENLYDTNRGEHKVSRYVVSATTGVPSFREEIAAGAFPSAIAFDPLGRWAFTASGTANEIVNFKMTAGVLSAPRSFVPGPVFTDAAATYNTWFVSTGPIPASP